jgi:branched-chain amino acid transport system substrate-binding protein
MLRIGILLPRSTLFPSIGLDILNGIKTCLKNYGVAENFKLLTDNIGFGIDEAEIYTKAERLLLQEDADVVLVIADTRIAEMLEPLFTTSNKLLLMVNLGATYPDTWQPAPTTLVHSLNLCLHTRLTGKLAAFETENKKGAYAISYYDAGYRQCYSLLSSHQQNGGLPEYTHVTHFKPEEFSLDALIAFLRQNSDVQTLLCLFAGDLVAQFINAITPLQQELQLAIYAGPMLLDELLSQQTDGNAVTVQHIKGYTPWTAQVENDNNLVFKEAVKKATNKKVNLFGVLGWDAALLLNGILQEYQAGNTNAADILPALSKDVYKSPRGWMKIDPVTFHSYGPSYLVYSDETMKLTLQEECKDIEKEWLQFTSETFPPGESSSWRNTYLCI